jgi:hypothetical protein
MLAISGNLVGRSGGVLRTTRRLGENHTRLPAARLEGHGLVMLDLDRHCHVLCILAHVEVGMLCTTTAAAIELKYGALAEAHISLRLRESNVLEGGTAPLRQRNLEARWLLVLVGNPAIQHGAVALDGVLGNELGVEGVGDDGLPRGIKRNFIDRGLHVESVISIR